MKGKGKLAISIEQVATRTRGAFQSRIGSAMWFKLEAVGDAESLKQPRKQQPFAVTQGGDGRFVESKNGISGDHLMRKLEIGK